MAKKPVDWKKILQAGAIATDAFSKGSAGGLGKTLAESDIDFSGMFKKNGRPRNVQIENGDSRLEANEVKKKNNYIDG
tara:strand:- start:141 stop:374 length:234 start_codon:yes stop_codon:yes gene_type:complete